MTLVNVKLYQPTDEGNIAASNIVVEFKPTTWSVYDNTGIIVPSSFEVILDTNGEAVVELTPTDTTWAWRVREKTGNGTTYYVSVPVSETPVNFWELPLIDPDTLEELPFSGSALKLNDLADVDVEGATQGMVLTYYVDETPGGSSGWTAGGLPPEPFAMRYTPILTATGLTYTGYSDTEPAYQSYYVKTGQIVSFSIKVNLSTVTNFGTGQLKLEGGLPVPALNDVANHFSAWCWINPSLPADDLNGHIQIVADHLPTSQTLDLHWLKAATSNPKPIIESILEQDVPATFTTNSIIYITGTYIAAN